jgi:hypothetical protein
LDKHGAARDDLQPVHPQLFKYAVPTRDTFDTTPALLHAIYVLQTTNTNTFELQPIKGLDKL